MLVSVTGIGINTAERADMSEPPVLVRTQLTRQYPLIHAHSRDAFYALTRAGHSRHRFPENF